MAQFQKELKRIGVYTSGGDAPGMNAAIRAVVRIAIAKKLEVYGIRNGYTGMIESNMAPLQLRDMANIIQRGGTVLKTGRSLDFLKKNLDKKHLIICRHKKLMHLFVSVVMVLFVGRALYGKNLKCLSLVSQALSIMIFLVLNTR